MSTVAKIKDWLKENAPMVSGAYENKYVGMVYDRFASLPPKQQKQLILGVFGTVVFVVFGYLFLSYLSLWSYSNRSDNSDEMINLLTQYQKQLRDKSGQINQLERNAALASPGQFKQHLLDQARNAAISPKMVEVEEKPDGAPGGDDAKGGSEVKLKQASVVLNRVNLAQLKNFLQAVEFGNYNLSVSSVKITNDDKIRGYMKVELGVVAYVFPTAEAGG